MSFRIQFLLAILLASVPAALAQSPEAGRRAAVIAGEPVYEDELLRSLQAQLRQLHTQEYELKRRALDDLINQKLLEAEAKKRSVPAEQLLQQEVDSRAAEPTDAEVEAFYLGQRDRLNRPLDDVKAQLRQTLKQAKLQQARQNYFLRLREKAQVAILLRPPKVEVAYDPARLKGSARAPVTIVEFSDFQCPYCRNVQATLKEVAAKYGDRVAFAHRDFPLRSLHPQAQSAAEASRCAGEQGKFWEYYDALFASQAKLDAGALAGYARSVGLDEKQFDSCVAGGKYRGKIEEDVQDGTRIGVGGTPAFFINGVFLSGAQPAAAFEKVIDEELAYAAGEPPAEPSARPHR